MGRPLAACISLLLFASAMVPAQTELELFPGTPVFPRFTADALQHSLSLTRVTENREWIGTIGGRVPVVQLSTPAYTAQAMLEVTTFNTLIKTPGHVTVFTVDYRVDFPLVLRLGALALRTGYGHISCHFADDGIEMLGKRSIQAIKDYVSLGAAYDVPGMGGFVYGNVDYIYHIVPERDRHWQLQIGAEAGNVAVAGFLRLYAAFDLKLKEQVAWGTTQSYQLGARLHIGKDLPLRIAYTYRTGFEERGQLYDQKVTRNLIGLYLEL